MGGGPMARSVVQFCSTTAAREATFPGMRVFVTSLVLSFLLSGPLRAADDQLLPPPSDSGRERLTSVVAVASASEAGRLLDSLSAASDAAVADRLETQIRVLWAKSGSATADLMLSWTAEAMAGGDAAKALDLLDEITVREPGFAEAYYRRATLNMLAGRFSPALSDLQVVLRIEPRHFLAIKALADIFVELDQPERALTLLRQLQAIDQHFSGLDEAIEAIVAGSHGRDI